MYAFSLMKWSRLGDDSSGEEEGKKKSKKKGFQFGSAKKDKKEKKELKDVKEKKDKKEKDKNKLKLKKLKMEADVDGKYFITLRTYQLTLINIDGCWLVE